MTTLIPKFDLKNGGSTPTGAVNRPINQKLGEIISVKDFGATGDGTTDDTTAFLNAIASLQGSTLYRGGTLYIPSGHYLINQALVFTSASGTDSSGHNIFIVGDGPYNTTLDFSSATTGTNGIQFGNGGNFGIEGILITGAKSSGIYLGDVPSSSNYCFYWTIKNVQVKNSVGNGFTSPFSYLGTIEDSVFENNGGSGIDLEGFHTSLNISRCSCPANAQGYTINGIVYSTLTSCAADSNTYAGYTVSNANGLVFNGCGAESNKQDGFYFYTSNASAAGVPTEAQNIRGVVLNSCVGLFNSVASAGASATFIKAQTTNSRTLDLIINGGMAAQNITGNTAFIFNGTSGTENIIRNNVNLDNVTYQEVNGGVVNETYTANGSTYYVNDVGTTDLIHNKLNYTSGNTYYSSFQVGGVLQGNISYNGTNVVYATTSDYRLKDNINPLTNGLDTICKLKPVSYVWKDSQKSDEGFIAHELQEIIPQAVVGEKDAVDEKGNPIYQSIDTSFIISKLVAAVQELKAEIDTLKRTI